MMDFVKEEWVHLGQWVQPTLSAGFWDGWTQESRNYPFSAPPLGGRLIILHGHHFVRRDDVDMLRKFLLENKNNFQLLRTFEQWVDGIHQKCKEEIVYSFPTPIEKIKKLQELCHDIVNPWIFFILVGIIVEENIQEFCTENDYSFQDMLQIIKPIRKAFAVLQTESADLLLEKIAHAGLSPNIALIERKNPDLANEIKKHIAQFEFVGVHHFVGKPYSLEQFFNTILHRKQNIKGKDIPADLIWWTDLASIAAWARTHMAETSGYIQHSARTTLIHVNTMLQLDEGDYLWLTVDEIIRLLNNPTSFLKPNLAERKEKVGIYSERGEEVVVAGKDVDALLDLLLQKEETRVFPLYGMIASQGKVVGKARIVIRPEDIEKVMIGDILVAPETSPDFIVGMKRAKGVITNQGGITSHAAIVSRELGVPCLVGVNGATSLITDGDLIELDAEKGEVNKVTSIDIINKIDLS